MGNYYNGLDRVCRVYIGVVQGSYSDNGKLKMETIIVGYIGYILGLYWDTKKWKLLFPRP